MVLSVTVLVTVLPVIVAMNRCPLGGALGRQAATVYENLLLGLPLARVEAVKTVDPSSKSQYEAIFRQI